MKIDVLEQYKKLVPPELLLENKRFSEYHGWGYKIDSLLSVLAGDYTKNPIGSPPYREKTVLIEKAEVNAEGTKGSLKEIAGLLHRQLSDQDDQDVLPSGSFPKKGILPILGYRLMPEPQLIFQMPPGFELPADADAAREAAGFGHVYLTNWRLLREASGFTTKKPGSDAWAERLYRHPHRQGLQIENRYNLGHDIYSLGVCLLEIGLWDSFVIRTAAAEPDGAMTVTPSANFVAASAQGGFNTEADMYKAENVKATLLRLASDQLPARVGARVQKAGCGLPDSAGHTQRVRARRGLYDVGEGGPSLRLCCVGRVIFPGSVQVEYLV